MVPRAFVGEIDDSPGNFAQELIAHLVAKEKFVGMAIEQESKSRIEPRPAEKLQIGESSGEVERRKHCQGLVEFRDASAVVEKDQAVDERAFTSGDADVVGAEFSLEETTRGGSESTGRSDAVVREVVKYDVLARAPREIVNGLEDLIGDSV